MLLRFSNGRHSRPWETSEQGDTRSSQKSQSLESTALTSGSAGHTVASVSAPLSKGSMCRANLWRQTLTAVRTWLDEAPKKAVRHGTKACLICFLDALHLRLEAVDLVLQLLCLIASCRGCCGHLRLLVGCRGCCGQLLPLLLQHTQVCVRSSNAAGLRTMSGTATAEGHRPGRRGGSDPC